MQIVYSLRGVKKVKLISEDFNSILNSEMLVLSLRSELVQCKDCLLLISLKGTDQSLYLPEITFY